MVLRGMYTGASAMMAQQVRTDVLANNLANVNTVGFKRESVVQSAFPDMLLRRVFDPVGAGANAGAFYGGGYDPRPVIGRLGTGAYVEGTWTVHADGPLQWTDNPLDVALVGPGFFVIETDDGVRLTRDGRFTLTQDGTMVTRSGLPVLGQDGGPIQVVGRDVAIDESGQVHVDGQIVATLQVVDVADVQSLRKQGEGLWALTDEAGPLQPAAARIHAGYVEQANVSAVQSMVELISAYRAYEASQKVIQAYDETLGKVVNDLGRA